MSENAKNRLLELLQNLGCTDGCAKFQATVRSAAGLYSSTVIVRFPDDRIVRGTGEGYDKTSAEIVAAQVAIDRIHNEHPDLIVNWDLINVEAQAGDALIKLGVYLSPRMGSPQDKSHRLQEIESDSHLATVFDRWKTERDPDLAAWGNGLGTKKKATLVEALLWRRFGMDAIAANAAEKFDVLLKTL